MSFILLDTNQLFDDPDLSSHDMRTVLKFCWHNDWEVLMSDVVLLEARRLYARKVDAALERASGGRDDKREEGRRRLRALLHTDDIEGVSAEAAADEYFLDLKQRGPPFEAIDRLPFPAISHEFVVDRLLAGKRPYHREAKKDGYRDLLIWMSVVEFLEKHDHEVVHLVSTNSSDFFDQQTSPPGLHPDLARDLELRDLSTAAVVCHRSLAAFVRDIVDVNDAKALTLRAAVFEPKVMEVGQQCVDEIALGPRVIYEAGSSFDVIERRIIIDRIPALLRAVIHTVYTPDGVNFIARAYADFDIGSGEHRIHHVKFRMHTNGSEGSCSRVAAGEGDPVRFGTGESEKRVAKSAWSRPWW